MFEMKVTPHDVKAAFRFGHRYVLNRIIHPYPPHTAIGMADGVEAEAETHILSSERDFAMACWTLASYYAMCEKASPVVMHDDGTLSRDDLETIRRIVPSVKIVGREEADAVVHEKFKCYPHLLGLRKRLPHMMKILDFHAFCQAKRFVIVDSDILFFSDPKELYEAGKSHRFSCDLETTYAVEPDELKKMSGIDCPPRVNCGMANVLKEVVDIEMMEWLLHIANIDLQKCPPYIEQTLWAMECGRGGFEYLPESYRICNAPGLKGLVAKHYTGLILDRFRSARDYFFVEGIPEVRRLVQCRSALL
jgi:hypothetical protein